MTIAVDQLGIESILLLEIYWGGGGVYKYADKTFGAYAGKILQANVVSKTGQIGQSGVSKTASVTLDDTDNSLRTLFNTLRMEGSVCNIYQYIDQTTPSQTLLMSGVVSSDIRWLEGERSLSFSIEGGTNRTGQSAELGYAPIENAFIGLNPNAEGKNWPVVFGTAAKVPAVRIEYYDDLTIKNSILYTDATFEINNGSQLPQSPTVIQLSIDRVLFEGTMTGDVFTPTSKNMPYCAAVAFEPRMSSDSDYTNPCVAWVPASINLVGLFVYYNDLVRGPFVNQCIGQSGTKCTFAIGWFYNELMDDSDTITEAARYCRTGWLATFTNYINGDQLMYECGLDTWFVYKDTAVVYDAGTDYMDRYVCNLYPSTDILAIWGKRQFNGKTKWEKIPSSYYHIHLSEAIVTDPGAVTRNVTVIDFPKPLKDYYCENWDSDIYVTVQSTLPATPNEIVDWVTTTLTSFSFDATSDDPPVTMNFAYFDITDAIEFIKGIAYQSASAIQINGNEIFLRFLAREPGISSAGMHEITYDKVIMKSLELGFKDREELNTIHRSTYVTDYSGEKTVAHTYEIHQGISEYGVQIKEDKMWALTCENPVKAVTDFWGVKTGNSWKTLKMDCFLDITDAEVFDGITFDIPAFVLHHARGLITSVVHDTDRPCVTIEVELAIKAGTNVEDPDYWNIGPATCIAPTDTEEDFTPVPDPKCAVYSEDVGVGTPRHLYHVSIVKWPPAIFRGVNFSLDLEIHDSDDVLVPIDAWFSGKLYTSCPGDCFRLLDFKMTAGKVTLANLRIRRSMFKGNIHFNIKCLNNTLITSGDIIHWRPQAL